MYKESTERKRWHNVHNVRNNIKANIQTVTRNQTNLNFTTCQDVCKTVDMSNLKQCDPDLKLLYRTKKDGQTPDKNVLKDTSPACRYYFNIWDSIVLKENLLYKKSVSKNGEYKFLQLITSFLT